MKTGEIRKPEGGRNGAVSGGKDGMVMKIRIVPEDIGIAWTLAYEFFGNSKLRDFY